MSTAVPQDFIEATPKPRTAERPLQQLLAVAGSLKVTCTLFVMGMFIIFVGSLRLASTLRESFHPKSGTFALLTLTTRTRIQL